MNYRQHLIADLKAWKNLLIQMAIPLYAVSPVIGLGVSRLPIPGQMGALEAIAMSAIVCTCILAFLFGATLLMLPMISGMAWIDERCAKAQTP